MSFIKTHVAYLKSMNKINIDGVLVVEGKDDVSYLSSFINALFFTTNGYDLSEEKIDFLSRAAKVNKVIIYTDPDDSGEVIRNKLKSRISPVFEAKSDKITRKNKKKSGVAELEKEEVIRSLKEFESSEIKINNYQLVKFISLSDNPKENKQKLIKKYRLIDGNIKYLENELNILRIKPSEIEELFSGN